MKYQILFALVTLGWFACKPSGAGPETTGEAPKDPAAFEKMLETKHDSMMARLTVMNDLSSRLRTIRSQAKENEEGKLDIPEGLDQAMEALKLADQGMWDWMKQYSDNKPNVKPEELMTFYTRQMELLVAVEAGINNSIDKAKAWLAAHERK